MKKPFDFPEMLAKIKVAVKPVPKSAIGYKTSLIVMRQPKFNCGIPFCTSYLRTQNKI
jgi:hypothetical protein